MSVRNPQRIALFGGSFDPVHLGHIEIAKAAQQRCELDRVIFLPCWRSPHKSRQRAPGEHRAAMLELATAEFPWATVSRWELERETPSYSWMTAERFKAESPDAELHWILGTDQWQALDAWAKPERLAELLSFIVFPRGTTVSPQSGFRHVAIDTRHPASSTAARRRIAAGEATVELLDPAVADYIVAHSLYS